jgi:alpha-1,6-mannosyltransferase
VALLGRIDDRPTLARIVASADLFVHGSAAETYGLAVAEALASGLTVVCPDYGGAADLATASRSRLYRAGDVRNCAQAIIDALAGGARPAASAPRGLDDHFADLFAGYEALITPAR